MGVLKVGVQKTLIREFRREKGELQMNKLCKGILISAVGLLFALSCWGAAFGQDIKIGVIGPMKFVQGQDQWNGAIMAADEINAKGGLSVGNKRQRVKLLKIDTNEMLSISDAVGAMERAIIKDKVDFFVGGFRSEAVFAMQDVAMAYKKIFIGCGASANELCTRVAQNYDVYKYWFRMTPYNSTSLARAAFINLATVAAILKQSLNIPQIKVAMAIEKTMAGDSLAAVAEGAIPKMGMELAGVWRPSSVATDVTAELSGIQRSGAQVIFTFFSSPVGIAFARQAGELKIPAVQVGINVEAQKDGFWKATQGMGNYVITTSTYARGVERNELEGPFVEGYIKRFGQMPTYTAGTYEAIFCALGQSIEQAGTLDPDKIVSVLEERVYMTPPSTIKYMKDAEGRPLHDITFGPGYATGLGSQWQDGKFVGVWPNKWKATPEAPEVTYKGIVPIKIPPWVVEKWKTK
ncbi:MAG TPA: ABC transporter substrate-binding protein [Thermodesulfobacteriota bacterium]|nr:ABC transporter substrate-binding protein [Thermodesulfobacteriota bacterium]